jgi:hypothetical protein
LIVVKPETVIAWHRKGFRLFWTWKVRHGQPGRPTVPKEVRELIRKMSRENPLWGAPRIHGELLKLGIDIGARKRAWVAIGMPVTRHAPHRPVLALQKTSPRPSALLAPPAYLELPRSLVCARPTLGVFPHLHGLFL